MTHPDFRKADRSAGPGNGFAASSPLSLPITVTSIAPFGHSWLAARTAGGSSRISCARKTDRPQPFRTLNIRRGYIFLLALSRLAQDHAEVTNKDERNPLSGQPGAIASGKKMFLEDCSRCQATNGEGARGPNLFRAWLVHDATGRHVFDGIQNSVAGSDMPLSRLPDHAICWIVAFLRNVNAPVFDIEVSGDSKAGQKIFFGRGGSAKSTTIGGRGGSPGPDLSNTGRDNSLSQPRESILKPDACIADRNRSVRVITLDGREIAGLARYNTTYPIVILNTKENLNILICHCVSPYRNYSLALYRDVL